MKVYFLGIGGVGMYALAERLLALGVQISGSDIQNNDFTQALINKGVNVFIEKTPLSVIEDSDVIIYSSAISVDNVYLNYAKKLDKCICSRAEVLGRLLNSASLSIGVAGSHGKTTATAMLANVLNENNASFTALIGGVDLNLNSYFSSGKDILLAEVCEYQKNIRYVSPTVSIVLNIDDDHLDTYKTLDNLKLEFFSYLDRGKVKIINGDDNLLKTYSSQKVITYGIKGNFDYTAYKISNVNGKYSFNYRDKAGKEQKVNLNVFGYHNIYNALSVIAVSESLNIPTNIINKGLNNFKGVKRRFEFIGEIFSKNLIADYCHHPEEIKATLKVASQVFNSDYLVVFQPHTYSRTKLLFDKFISVLSSENTVIFKEYSARENYDYLGSAKHLNDCLKNSLYCDNLSELISFIKNSKHKNILILGAGNLYDKIKEFAKNYTV